MKICPTCRRSYEIEGLNFCRDDGTPLQDDSSALAEGETRLIGGASSGSNFEPTKIFSPQAPQGDLIATAPFGVSSRKQGSRKAVTSVAILPLENAGDDPEMEYLSDGITESIINTLSQLPRLRVMARSTVFRYKGQSVNPQAVGRELGVRAVLTGRVIQFGDRLVIKTELVDVTDGAQLWGEHYKRKFSDIFKVEEEIAREITNKLRLKLTGEEKKRLVKRYTDDSEAYQLYLKGRYHWNKRTREGLKRGISYFEQAIDADRVYALAHAGLGDSYILLGYYSYLAPTEAFAKAKQAALEALKIDNTLAEAHTALAEVKLHYDWDWTGSESEFKRAIELRPNYAHAHHWYSHLLVALGRFKESFTESKKAEELDPLNLIINAHLGWHFHYARDFDRAIEQCRKTIEMEPNFGVAHFYVEPAYEQKQRYVEAVAEAQKAVELLGDSPEAVACLGHAYAASGQTDQARRVLNELTAKAETAYVSAYSLALINIGLGDTEQALHWLERAFDERSSWLAYLKVDPRFDSLRADPRLIKILHDMNLA